jgi:hypothetical protein
MIVGIPGDVVGRYPSCDIGRGLILAQIVIFTPPFTLLEDSLADIYPVLPIVLGIARTWHVDMSERDRSMNST